MTIEEIKEKFRNSKKWELFQETDEYEIYFPKNMTNLFVRLRNDGFLSISDKTHACYFVSRGIPVVLFQVKEHDDRTEIYIENPPNPYGGALNNLILYL